MAPVRSVGTSRVPRQLVEDLSRRMGDRIQGSGTFRLASTSTRAEDVCLVESCEINAARQAGARAAFHTRLVQYGDSCVLLAALYDAESGHDEWSSTSAFPCEAAAVDAAMGTLSEAFLTRAPPVPRGPVFAVTPIQHDVTEIAFATESFAEYLTTLMSAAGHTTLPASGVASPLVAKKVELNKSCDKGCAIGLAPDATAEKAVVTKITRKNKVCTIVATVHDLATKDSSVSANAKGGCESANIAEGLRTIASALTPAPPKAEPPPPPPPPQGEDLK